MSTPRDELLDAMDGLQRALLDGTPDVVARLGEVEATLIHFRTETLSLDDSTRVYWASVETARRLRDG